MGRAERRRLEKQKGKQVKTYNLTRSQLHNAVRQVTEEDLKRIKQEGYGGCHKYSYDITLSTSYGGTHGSLLEKDLCKEDTRVYRAGITVL